jgi:hypothetical protein
MIETFTAPRQKEKMQSVGVFIISWRGQHDRAASVARSLEGQSERLTIIYSDPDPDLQPDVAVDVVKRPNDLYWADKFASCLNRSDCDIMLVIHADCSAADWPAIVRSCRAAMTANPQIAVWAPLIDGASYDLELVRLIPFSGTPLWLAADTDGIVFALNSKVVERMKQIDYSKNIYGWGISAMFCAAAFASKSLVVIDTSVKVTHPLTRGNLRAYPEDQAWALRGEFLKQLRGWEVVQNALLWSHIQKNRQIRDGRKT